MSIEIVKAIFVFIGGIAMFMYGMQVMADGLQQAAGEKTRHLLEILTGNRLMGVLVGAAVTAIIQSSGATTVMVVGFVNAHLMSLQQAVGVIMGANIGTTMTAWIVSVSEWGTFLQPEMIAPILLMAGVILYMFVKNERMKQVGDILIGFGILFIGLSTMSGAITPYADAPIFTDVFRMIGSNPLLGLLVGAIVTAIMQSSSASMGILQTLALNGIVNWGSAVFIALGQNIGTCVVALISSIGTDTNARRAAMIHLEFNTIGALIVGIAAAALFWLHPELASMQVTSTNLALFHTSFNVLCTILLFPFANQLVYLSRIIVPDVRKSESASSLVHLDERLLKDPSVALSAVQREIIYMGKLALENIGYSRDCLINNTHFRELNANEETIDTFYQEVGDFLGRFDVNHLSTAQQRIMRNCLLALRDVEHVSDRCMEIAQMARQYITIKDLNPMMIEDINTISTECEKAFGDAVEFLKTRNVEYLRRVFQYEHDVDDIQLQLRSDHMKDFEVSRNGITNTLIFLEAVDRYERICDHAKTLAHYEALNSGIDEERVTRMETI